MATIFAYRRFERLPTTSAGAMALRQPSQVRDVIPHPARMVQGAVPEDRTAVYEQLFAYYSNTAFNELRKWAIYRRNYGLYKYTRGIFNPVARLVNFYAEHVYPGSLSEQGAVQHDNGGTASIPLALDTPEAVRTALTTLWRWSNWQTKQALMVTYGAMLGNCLVEVVDDAAAEKVSYRVMHPSFVRDFELDSDGALLSYDLEYPIFDSQRQAVRQYRKRVNAFRAEVFLDNELQYVREIPYGFAPAVWVKHLDLGSEYGVPAIHGCLSKIDELNSVAAHTADHVHKQINSPRVLWTNSTVRSLFRGEGEESTVDEADMDARNETLMLKGAQGGTTETLVGNLDPATIIPILNEMIREIEKDLPELTFYDKLRDQNIVSSPGARTLMGDVDKKLRRAAANYDAASVRLFAMGLAIGGYRANLAAEAGGWRLSDRISLFRSFTSDLYSKGQLDVRILPRPLVPETSRDIAEEFQLITQGIGSLGDNTLPLTERLKWLGYEEGEIPAVVAELEQEIAARTKREQAQAQAQKQPAAQRQQTGKKSSKQATQARRRR